MSSCLSKQKCHLNYCTFTSMDTCFAKELITYTWEFSVFLITFPDDTIQFLNWLYLVLSPLLKDINIKSRLWFSWLSFLPFSSVNNRLKCFDILLFFVMFRRTIVSSHNSFVNFWFCLSTLSNTDRDRQLHSFWRSNICHLFTSNLYF